MQAIKIEKRPFNPMCWKVYDRQQGGDTDYRQLMQNITALQGTVGRLIQRIAGLQGTVNLQRWKILVLEQRVGRLEDDCTTHSQTTTPQRARQWSGHSLQKEEEGWEYEKNFSAPARAITAQEAYQSSVQSLKRQEECQSAGWEDENLQLTTTASNDNSKEQRFHDPYRRPVKTATKPRKSIKRKAKRVTKKMQTGSKRKVWNGTAMYTKSGLMKNDLCINKRGKVVSKKAMSNGKKRLSLSGWLNATLLARKQLGLKGFVACKKGTKYYKLAKKLYDKLKELQ